MADNNNHTPGPEMHLMKGILAEMQRSESVKWDIKFHIQTSSAELQSLWEVNGSQRVQWKGWGS